MGACYSVDIKLKYKDKKKVINALNQYIENNKKRVMFHLFNIDRTDLSALMKVILTDQIEDINETDNEFKAISDFEASYGWEIVINEMFNALSSTIENGSYIYIEPDNEHYTLLKCNDIVDNTDSLRERLKKELFMRGSEAIEDFLGTEHYSLEKDSLEKMMEETADQMPENLLFNYYYKYIKE